MTRDGFASSGKGVSSLPKGFAASRLSDLAVSIVGGGTPSRHRSEFWSGDIPWVSVKNMQDGSDRFHGLMEHISDGGLNSCSSRIIPPYTPIIATRMAVGRCAISKEPVAINQDLKAIFVDQKLILPKFLTNYIIWKRSEIERGSIGSTVRGITLGQLRDFVVIFPSVLAQQKILEVFDDFDSAIESTARLISKLEVTKTATVTSELKTIENDEGVQKISLLSLCNPKQGKTLSLSRLLQKGYKVYGANSVLGYYSEYSHEHPTVAIGCRGTCGNVFVTEPQSFITGNAMALSDIRPDVDPTYLAEYLKYRTLADTISGSAQPQITRTALAKVSISVPSRQSQERITRSTSSFNESIRAVAAKLEKLRNLRNSLTDALLSGREPVTIGMLERIQSEAA